MWQRFSRRFRKRSIGRQQSHPAAPALANRQPGESFREVEQFEPRRLLTMPAAPLIALDASGFGIVFGEISSPGETDIFRYEAPENALIQIDQFANGSSVNTFLEVQDENCVFITDDDDGGFGTDSLVTLEVAAGDVLHFVAGAFGTSTGAYALSITPIDDFGDGPGDAGFLPLDEEGAGSITGTFEAQSDQDFIQIVSPLSGTLTIRQEDTDGLVDSLLIVRDEFGGFIDFNDDFEESFDSQVTVSVDAGETLFIDAQEAFGRTGGYVVTVSGDFGNTDSAATPLTGLASVNGAISPNDDVDVFQVTSPVAGVLTIDLFATDFSFDPVLTVRDEFGSVVVQNDDFFGTDSRVSFLAFEGERFFVQASGFAGQPGSYGLRVSDDEHGNDDDSATPLSVDPVVGVTTFSSIDFEDDVDVFEIVAPETGLLRIDLFGSDFFFDSALTVRDEFGFTVAENDDFNSGLNSTVLVEVNAGDTLFIEAAELGGVPGDFGLTVTPIDPALDDFGNDVLTASVIELDDVFGNATVTGILETATDVDVFEITSTIDGFLDFELSGDSEFVPRLRVTDQFGNVVVETLDFGSAFADIAVNDGDRLFVKVEDAAAQPNLYTLNVFGFSFGPGDQQTAPTEPGTPIVLDAAGSGMASGVLNAQTDIEVFQITSPITGQLVIEQLATSSDVFFDPCPTVFNAEGNVLASAFNAEFFQQDNDLLGTRLFVNVMEDQVLTITAGSFTGFGSYDLVIAAAAGDDFSDIVSLDTATPVALDPETGSATQAGVIGTSGDRDVFSVQAQTDGVLTIEANAASGSSLDPILTVFDQDGVFIAENDDSFFSSGLNSRLDIPVSAGQTLLVKTTGFFSSTGAYDLVFTPGVPVVDDFDDTIDDATPLAFDGAGNASQSGVIEQPNDVDVFSIVTPADVFSLTFSQSSPDGELDSFLRVLDASGQEITFNDDSGFTLDSEVVVPTSPGTQLFVEAGSFPGSRGSYDLVISSGAACADDFGNDDANAEFFALAPGLNDADLSGTIGTDGDRDVFTTTFAADGTVRVFLNAGIDGFLDPLLRIRDANGAQIAFDDDSGFDLNSQTAVTVRAGDQLFIDAGAFADSSSGDYFLDVLFTPGAAVDDVPVNNIDQALGTNLQAQTIPATGLLTISGVIDVSFDADVFKLTAPASDSPVDILIQQTADLDDFDFFNFSGLDSVLTVFNALGDQIAFNDDSFFSLDSELVLTVPGGSSFFVQAGAFGSSTGGYDLTFEVFADDFVNTQNGAQLLEFDAVQAGAIERSGDVDVFKIGMPDRPEDSTLPDEIRVQVAQTATSDSLDSFLTIFRQNVDGSLEFVAFNDDSNGTLNSEVEFEMKLNDVYFIFAQGFGSSIGNYELTVTEVLADDFANSFAGADLLAIGGDATSASRTGDIDPDSDQDVFMFVSDRNGTGSIELIAGPGLDGRISVFEVNTTAPVGSAERDPVRVARVNATGDDGSLAADLTVTATFPLISGREYFVSIDSDSGTQTGAYDLTAQVSDNAFDPGAVVVPDDVLESVTELVREQFAAGVDLEEILDNAAGELQSKFGDLGDNEFLLFVTDPVDFVLAGSDSRRVGFTASEGRINEVNGAALTQNAPVEVLILPTTDRSFDVQLQGVGTDFRVGGRVVTEAGVINGNLTSTAGETVSASGTLNKDDGNVALVFDFTDRPNAFPQTVADTSTPDRDLTATTPLTVSPGDQLALSTESIQALQDLRDTGDDRGYESDRLDLFGWLVKRLKNSDQKPLQFLGGTLEDLADTWNGDADTEDSDVTNDEPKVSGKELFWSVFGGGVMNHLWELGDQIIENTSDADATETNQDVPEASDNGSPRDGEEEEPSEATGRRSTRNEKTSTSEETSAEATPAREDIDPWSRGVLVAQTEDEPVWSR